MKNGTEISSESIHNSKVCKRKIACNRREERREISGKPKLPNPQYIVRRIAAEESYYTHMYEIDSLMGKIIEPQTTPDVCVDLASQIAHHAMKMEAAADEYVQLSHRLQRFSSRGEE